MHWLILLCFTFQRIRDYQLIGVVLGLLGVLCFVLVAWEIVDPVFIQIRYLEREVGVIINPFQTNEIF